MALPVALLAQLGKKFGQGGPLAQGQGVAGLGFENAMEVGQALGSGQGIWGVLGQATGREKRQTPEQRQRPHKKRLADELFALNPMVGANPRRKGLDLIFDAFEQNRRF